MKLLVLCVLLVHEGPNPPAQHFAMLDDMSTNTRHGTSAVISMTERSLLHAGAPGALFQDRNRMGVSQTLHRISALQNRHGDVCGLTYRIGRHIPGKEPWASKDNKKPSQNIAFSDCFMPLSLLACRKVMYLT